MTAVLHRGAETHAAGARAAAGRGAGLDAARALGRRRDARAHRRPRPLRLRGGLPRPWSGAIPEPVDYAGRTDQQIALTMLAGEDRAPAAGAGGARRRARAAQGGAWRAEGYAYPGVPGGARGAARARRRDPVAADRQHPGQRRRQGERLRARALARLRGRRLRLGPARGALRSRGRGARAGGGEVRRADRGRAGGRHAARRARRPARRAPAPWRWPPASRTPRRCAPPGPTPTSRTSATPPRRCAAITAST